MRKRPSSIDVARRADVSQATVSYVLSNRTDKAISEETRSRVLQAAEDLGYMPNRLADGILRGKTSTIGVLMPDFAHTFNSHLLAGLEGAFAEAGYRLLIAHNRNDPEIERNQVRLLMEHRIDGIVAVADEATVSEMPAWVEEAVRHEIPVVVIDDLGLDGVVDTVVSDDVRGASLAVEHLIEQGHRRIAYLGGSEKTTTSRDRRIGYESTLLKHGIELDSALEIGQSYRTRIDPDLSPVLSGANPATGIFSVSDGLIAQSLISLEQQGFETEQPVAYVGYGNLEFSRYLSMTTVEQHPGEMGRHAALRMVARLQGDGRPAITERIEPSLIIRRSSKFPKRIS